MTIFYPAHCLPIKWFLNLWILKISIRKIYFVESTAPAQKKCSELFFIVHLFGVGANRVLISFFPFLVLSPTNPKSLILGRNEDGGFDFLDFLLPYQYYNLIPCIQQSNKVDWLPSQKTCLNKNIFLFLPFGIHPSIKFI